MLFRVLFRVYETKIFYYRFKFDPFLTHGPPLRTFPTKTIPPNLVLPILRSPPPSIHYFWFCFFYSTVLILKSQRFERALYVIFSERIRWVVTSDITRLKGSGTKRCITPRRATALCRDLSFIRRIKYAYDSDRCFYLAIVIYRSIVHLFPFYFRHFLHRAEYSLFHLSAIYYLFAQAQSGENVRRTMNSVLTDVFLPD